MTEENLYPLLNAYVEVDDTDLGITYNAYVTDIELYSDMCEQGDFDDSRDFTYIVFTKDGVDSIENAEILDGSVIVKTIKEFSPEEIFNLLASTV